ncbi:hypothetical protein A7U60_g7557 [Sanghuangporus baumii]|uniref:F-box domain-containing protein n=1 Tax=Sanghuangporus baumii TaxID=108892 RepID=A0A9Q5N081_SANBA|nr:hypothetical protein A7U60_g7557 [Sanghuangporus baumii]
MFSYTANIPPEIWVYILRETVFPCWSNEAFFPPPDDFTLITGFKGACSAFKLLAKETERLLRNQNINIVDSGEILRSEDADLIQIKYVVKHHSRYVHSSYFPPGIVAHIYITLRRLAIKHKVTLADFQLFIPRCSNLVSLSLAFAERSFGLLGPQTILASQNLIRLDIVYENIWWHAPTFDFPNLRELRLSSRNPFERHRDPVYVPLENTNSERFAADLVSTVRKLQRLKLLSVHIVLDHQRSRTALISSIHHVHRMTLKFAPIAFTRCGECIRYYSKVVREYAEVVRSREAKLSVMLAEILPLLEKVMWIDTWNESYCDEEGMRESRIVRTKDGKILVRIQGEVVPPLETFSLD